MIKIKVKDKYYLDLSQDVQLSLNFSQTDFDNPTTNFAEFSKQFTVPNTKNNSEAFGNIDNLESTFSVVNPKNRIDCTILDVDENIIVRGYLQVNGISNKNGISTYSLTFFGAKCDFFYSLQYGEDGTEKTLASLYYGFLGENDTVLSPLEEKQKNIVQLSRLWIEGSWNKLNSTFNSNNMHPNNWITAVPTYSGLYGDDFKSNIVLFNNMSNPQHGYMPGGMNGLFKNTEDNVHFGSGKGSWWKIEVGRDMVEWETKDFRGRFQRPAVRTQLILDAICNPDNNGGYEVEIDDEIKNKDYYKTWTMFNRIDFTDAEDATPEINLQWLSRNPIYGDNLSMLNTWEEYVLADESGNTTFDCSNLINPSVTLDILSALRFYNLPTSNYTYTTFAWSALNQNSVYIGGIGMRLEVRRGLNVIAHTPYYYYTTEPVKLYKGKDFRIEDYRTQIMTKMGINSGLLIKEKKPYEVITNLGGDFYSAIDDLKLNTNFYNMTGLSFVLKIGYFDYNTTSYSVPSIVRYNTPNDGLLVTCMEGAINHWKLSVDFDTVSNSGVYEGDANVKNTNVTKSMLFGEKISPYNYLMSFAKQFGLKFEVDEYKKKVWIKLRKNYYQDKVVELDGKINLDKGYTINTILSEKKYAQYGLKTPDSYAEYIYSKKNKLPYGTIKLNTNTNFNSETEEIFDKNDFKAVVPYKLNSLTFNNIPILNYTTPTPAVALIQKYTTTTWFDGEPIEIEQYGLANYQTVPVIQDPLGEKICCFDKDNANLDDIDLTLVYFNGFTPISGATLSDDIPSMYDIAEGSCYILSYWCDVCYMNDDDYNQGQMTECCTKLNQIPKFGRYKYDEQENITESLDFAIPNSSFVTNITNYDPETTIYNQYWKNYLEDIYSKNSKEVEIYVELPQTNMNQLFKQFYLFKGNLWVLNSVSDYNPDNKYTKCKFVEVQNKHNYLS